MTKETLEFFSELLGQVQLNAGHPDFERQARRVIAARAEINEALDGGGPSGS